MTATIDAPGSGTGISAAEWASRVDCAAGHRLLDRYGLTDLVEGMVGVRVADEPDAFLVKAYGDFFEEVRASDLHKVRFDERPDVGRGRPLNYSSCNQIRDVLAARPDVNCVIHTHTDATAIVASLPEGFQPVEQHGFIVERHVAYVDFDVEIDDECMDRTVAALDDQRILLMRNHGMMVVGKDVAEAFFLARTLDVACRCQVDALPAADRILQPSDDPVENVRIMRDYATHPEHVEVFDGTIQWPGLLRMLDRHCPDFRD